MPCIAEIQAGLLRSGLRARNIKEVPPGDEIWIEDRDPERLRKIAEAFGQLNYDVELHPTFVSIRSTKGVG